MNALSLLALLQMQPATPGLHSGGWSPLLWFWVLFGAVMTVVFFAMAFRKPRLPPDDRRHLDEDEDERRRVGPHDREVYP